MTSEAAISEPVDPLSGLCGPSLFPRTIRASTDAALPSEPKDLDSIHHFMKSLKSGPRSPEKLLEEAKAIVDGGSELLNSKFAAFTMSLAIDDASPARGNEKPREKRPALGHKRARFSLKPNSSQSSEIVEPSLNIDQLQDPEEFFKAFERRENAEKEIQRQKGGSIAAFDEINLSQNTRRRRPALSRKSVTYKHRYPLVSSENEDTFIPSQLSENKDMHVPSQGPLELNVPIAPNSELLQGTDDSDGYSPDIDVGGSVSKRESRVNKILDELLSSNIEDLDGDGAVTLLQERLQFKHIELSTLDLPDFHDIGRTDFMALRKNLSKSRRASLEVQNLVKRTSKETPTSHKQIEASSSLASPTPPKSPFAQLSLLNKRILQSNPSRDPFSPLNIDLETPGNLSSVDQVDNKLDEVSGRKRFNIFGKLEPLTEDGITKLKVSNRASEKVIVANSESLPDQSPTEDGITKLNVSNRALEKVIEKKLDEVSCPKRFNISGKLESLTEDGIRKLKVFDRASEKLIMGNSDSLLDQSLTEDGITKLEISNRALEKVLTGGADSLVDKSMDKSTSSQSRYVDVTPNESHSNLGVHRDGHNMDGTSSENIGHSDLMDGPDMMKENVEDDPRLVVSSLKEHEGVDFSTKSASATNGHGSRNMETDVEDMPSAALPAQLDISNEESTIPENLNDDQRVFDESHPATTKECTINMLPTVSNSKQEAKKLPPKNAQPKRKRSPVGRRERKTLSNRPSIADGGTSFEAGVRRSKRVKSRPLEYWKGERFLYGRVNGGMKLIGLKYISPSKGEGELKVKPYVSNEYNDLLELAAKH